MPFWTAFVLGLVGSLHCAGMCGPLALALPAQSNATFNFFLGRIAYNLGRVLTYCALGLLFGVVGRATSLAGVQRWASIGLGLLVLLGFMGSRQLIPSNRIAAWVGVLKSWMSFALKRRSVTSVALLGLLNGLLPCGLVYVACAAAVATGSVFHGLLYMATFGAGTIPIMLAISLSGKLVPFSMRLKLQRAVPLSACILAVLLILRGMSLGIPYLSPDLNHPSCCSPLRHSGSP
jgi:sulfite exporter TauE/SafE